MWEELTEKTLACCSHTHEHACRPTRQHPDISININVYPIGGKFDRTGDVAGEPGAP